MTTHGLSQHPFHQVWTNMIHRCENPDNKSYHRYGGRGITVCNEWQDRKIFIDWLVENSYEKGLQIDRIDNDGSYFPDNCRVVTQKENRRNRGDNVRYMVHGEMLLSIEVEERFGINECTFRHRVNKQGCTPENALIDRHTHVVGGKLMTAREISAEYGINYHTVKTRIGRGWQAERAAMTPVGG